MKKFLTILLFTVLITGTVVAQGVERDVDIFPEQVSIEHNDAVKQRSQQYVSMGRPLTALNTFINSIMQADQTAIINQFGNDNIASISQTGNGNNAYVTILGDRNEAGVEQYGDDNFALLKIIGDDNKYGLLQEGNENKFVGGIFTNGYQNNYTQSGNGLSFTLQGPNSMGLMIEQIGQGFDLIIESN
ncbi:curlin repeat-containing protein [Gracilimonas sp. Q87]|uniref:curlin repeat-containing protein n=1 Tax=Gracilimonas sp. Q87 TaxID=3384766 RepID=UPI0039843002